MAEKCKKISVFDPMRAGFEFGMPLAIYSNGSNKKENKMLVKRSKNRDSMNPFGWDDFGIDNFFPENILRALTTNGGSFNVDVKETDTQYVIQAELPGVKEEELTLTFENDHLSIECNRGLDQEDKNENFYRREIFHGQMARSFYIPSVNSETISAKLDNGILTVTLDKDQAQQRKTIKVEMQ